jgi:hypothetical protein
MSDQISTSDIAGSPQQTDQPSDSGNGSDAPGADDRGPHADPNRSVEDIRRESESRRESGGDASTGAGQDGRQALVSSGDAEDFTRRWDEIQAGFVDQPKDSVQNADALVAELMKRLAETFAAERKNLEEQWSSGKDVSTEDLRVALQRYRSFFHRLLST